MNFVLPLHNLKLEKGKLNTTNYDHNVRLMIVETKQVIDVYHMGGFLPVCTGAHFLPLTWPPPGWYVPTTLHWNQEWCFAKLTETNKTNICKLLQITIVLNDYDNQHAFRREDVLNLTSHI